MSTQITSIPTDTTTLVRVINTRTGSTVKEYGYNDKNKNLARNFRDKKDNEHGSYIHKVVYI